MNEKIQTLDEFWPYYVREHSHLKNRQLHFIGNINLFVWLLYAFSRRSSKLILVAIASSYGFAWIGHFFFEKKEPATFHYPLLAGICNLVMFVQTLRGAMKEEVRMHVGEGKQKKLLG